MFREAGRVRSKKQLWAYGPSLPYRCPGFHQPGSGERRAFRRFLSSRLASLLSRQGERCFFQSPSHDHAPSVPAPVIRVGLVLLFSHLSPTSCISLLCSSFERVSSLSISHAFPLEPETRPSLLRLFCNPHPHHLL